MTADDGGLWDRLTVRDGVAFVGATDVAAAEVVDRLEAGEAAEMVARSLDLSATDLVAVLAADALGPVGSAGPSLVRVAPRRPRLAAALGEGGVASLWPGASRQARLALAAGLLQVHDFWDLSHEAAQLADDLGERAVSAYWHGIAHRREPDPGNAAYWFRRVGRHPVFVPLAARARPIVSAVDPDLVPRSGWDPIAFIELTSTGKPSPDRLALAGKLQRLEMGLLLNASLPS